MERLEEEKILSYYRERMAASNPNKEGITAFDSYREGIDASNPYKDSWKGDSLDYGCRGNRIHEFGYESDASRRGAS